MFLDTVEGGISSFDAFASKVEAELAAVLGPNNPLVSGLAALHAMIQQDVAAVEVMVEGVAQKLVMTLPVYQQIMAFASRVAADVKSGAPGSVMADLVAIATPLLKAGIPLALTVVAPGSGVLVTLAEDTLATLLPNLFAGL